MSEQAYHIPALLAPCIEGLSIKPDGAYVDATFGGGGHSRAIMEKLGEKGRLFGFDQDINAWQNRLPDPRFTFVHSNFRYLQNFLRYHGVEKIDGLLADLGLSFHHLYEAERGFSFRLDGPLKMCMNPSRERDAAHIVATYSAQQLTTVLSTYGELRQAHRIAAAIVKARDKQPITTTHQLANAVQPLINPAKASQEMAQVFQALRIEVNDELGAIKQMLEAAAKVVRKGGRIAVISYHSLEDKLVKNFFRSGTFDGEVQKDFYGKVLRPLQPVNKSVIVASDEEVEANPRARSAKLRIAEVL